MSFPLRMRRASDPLLVFVDVISALLASYLAYVWRFGSASVPRELVNDYQGITVGVAVLWVVIARMDGLYRRAALRPGVSNLEEAVLASLGCVVALALIDVAFMEGDLDGRWILAVGGALVLTGCGSRILLRRARRFFTPFKLFLERYAILGDDAQGHRLFRDLTRGYGRPFQVVTLFSMGVSVDELLAECRARAIDGIVVPEGRLTRDQHASFATRLAGAGVDLLIAPTLGELDLRVSSFAMLHGVPLLRTAGLAPRRRAIRVPPRLRKKGGVAILGTRGVPARTGRTEVVAERLASYRQQGVPVTVYGRKEGSGEGKEWNGVRLVRPPAPGTGRVADAVHGVLCTAHLIFGSGARDVLLCDAANGWLLVPLRFIGFRRSVVLLDSLDWRRGTTGAFGRTWSRAGEWFAVRLAAALVTNSAELRTYLRVRHDTDALVIPPGADFVVRGTQVLDTTLGVEPDSYVVVTEGAADIRIATEAHSGSGIDTPLVVLGEVDDLESVERTAAPSAIFAGATYGERYQGLLTNARVVVHAGEVGGAAQGLVDALAAGNLCLVLDTVENRAVAADVVRYFHDANELADLLRWADKLTEAELQPWREASALHAAARFSWQEIGGRYQSLLMPTV